MTCNIPVLIMWRSIFTEHSDLELREASLHEMMELALIDIVSVAPREKSKNSVDTADVRAHSEPKWKASERHMCVNMLTRKLK